MLSLESITDQVRRLVRTQIESGQLTPGTRIMEEGLASELGISKSPIRLALYQLKQEEIVRIEPRKGFFVAVPTTEQVIELLEMREVLEGLAARLAASRRKSADIKELEACFRGFDETTLEDRRAGYTAADIAFQRLVAKIANSTELMKTLEAIDIRLHLSRMYNNLTRHKGLVPFHRDHLALIRAIKAGDADRAEIIASAHVATVRRMALLKIGQEAGADQPSSESITQEQ